jgi:voltage-gated potassium channel
VLWATDERWAYTRKAWLDLTIIVVSFPFLPAVLASTRLLRLTRLTRVLRLLRLVRLAAVMTRGTSAVRAILGKRGVGFAMALTILVALGAGGLFALVEPESVPLPTPSGGPLSPSPPSATAISTPPQRSAELLASS